MSAGGRNIFKLVTLIFLLYSTQAYSDQAYTFNHRDCIIRHKSPLEDAPELTNTLVDQLNKRGFSPKALRDNKRLLEGELYILVEKQLVQDKLVFKDCIIKILLKKSTRNRIIEKDKIVYQKEIKRSFPRVTPKGKERCERALKDAFIHIPYCKKP